MKINYFVCWQEDNIKKWDMVKGPDFDVYMTNLMTNPNIDLHSVFIIPASSIISGIWLQPKTHKSNRVDFFNFFDDFGTVYDPPKAKEENKKVLKELEERNSDNTKYGWISPDGRYYHCGYQGHGALADRICFGMADTNNPERYLEENGWCKIYKPILDKEYSVYIDEKKILTDAQMKTLLNMGLDRANGLKEILSNNEKHMLRQPTN